METRENPIVGYTGGGNHLYPPPTEATGIGKQQTALQPSTAETEARYHALMDAVPDAILSIDESGRIESLNSAAEELFGYSPDRAVGCDVRALLAAFKNAELERDAAKNRNTPWGEMTARHEDGSTFPVEVLASEVGEMGQRQFVLVIRDLTERKILQEQLFSAQRMQAVGRLAGGIAHDFNNFLTVFSCNIELMNEALRRQPASDPALPTALDQIQKAWKGASGLTRQLLAFSRREAVRPVVLDADQAIGDMERMLRPLLGEHIRFEVARHPGIGRIKIDAGHLEQVVMNLTINACDAMPEGGTLRIQTSRESRPGECAATTDSYVCITVSDTGMGMDREVLGRAFEPLFTTKPAGKGTGLGLATVDGIVREAGGHVSVESASGRGTTFRVYLPLVSAPHPMPAAPAPAVESLGGSETVLICEDEAMILRLTSQILTARGYKVLAAGHPREALSLAAAHEGPLHLLVTDTIMPEMNGPRLAEILSEEHPEMSVLFTSGYTSDILEDYGLATESVELLEKPFTPAGLLNRVRKVLDSADAVESCESAPPPRPVRVPPSREPAETCAA